MSEKNFGKNVSKKSTISIAIFVATIVLIGAVLVPSVSAALTAPVLKGDRNIDSVEGEQECPLCAAQTEVTLGATQPDIPNFDCDEVVFGIAQNISAFAIETIVTIIQNTDWDQFWSDVYNLVDKGVTLTQATITILVNFIEEHEDEIRDAIDFIVQDILMPVLEPFIEIITDPVFWETIANIGLTIATIVITYIVTHPIQVVTALIYLFLFGLGVIQELATFIYNVAVLINATIGFICDVICEETENGQQSTATQLLGNTLGAQQTYMTGTTGAQTL